MPESLQSDESGCRELCILGILYLFHVQEVRFGEIEERADEVNDTAYELLDDIEAKWLKKHKPKNPNSFTEQLQLRTQTRMMAEEIVIMDVVMQFH